MKKSLSLGITLSVMVVTSAVVGYKIATDEELRDKIIRSIQDVFAVSKSKISGMSEDVAMRTAQLTRNPKVNQEWVSQQWDALGL